jgi:hypothetical protein
MAAHVILCSDTAEVLEVTENPFHDVSCPIDRLVPEIGVLAGRVGWIRTSQPQSASLVGQRMNLGRQSAAGPTDRVGIVSPFSSPTGR